MNDFNNLDDIKTELNYHQTLLNQAVSTKRYYQVHEEAETVSKLSFMLVTLLRKEI